MRITNNMLVMNLMNNLNTNLSRMDKTQQNLSSGKKFQLPSDDPIGVSKSLKYHTDLSRIAQYKRNLNDSISWLQVTEDSLTQVGEIMKRTKELTVQALNGTNSPSDKQKISEEIGQLKEQLIKVSNATYAGRSIFTGYKTDTDLLDKDGYYKLTNYKNGSIGAGVTDMSELSNDEVSIYNIGVSDQIKVNTVGIRLFGKYDGSSLDTPSYTDDVKGYKIDKTNNISEKDATTDKSYLIALFDDIKATMDADDHDGLDKDLGRLDAINENVLSLRAEIGAKCNRLEMTQSRMDDEELIFTKLMSDNEDIDMAETIMNSKMQESVYNASLAVGTKIIQPTLVDFLR
ncbi:flagellar hook-associated protein FlgL [Abyssisolibacter fermentans]|uniref:flagellar hook-associated protein FlgL n=1 Tax=Abyssisolibacter fermentans TaxID=1766203 RepID=UPI00082B775D|nr:flagellar hook-associated protein FlgL [Abyssisolibacter fermentans]